MPQPDGGPAFPVFYGQTNGMYGMSLRDWFAGTCNTQGYQFNNIEAAARYMGRDVPKTNEEILAMAVAFDAKLRYVYADAMLRAREF